MNGRDDNATDDSYLINNNHNANHNNEIHDKNKDAPPLKNYSKNDNDYDDGNRGAFHFENPVHHIWKKNRKSFKNTFENPRISRKES